MAYLRDMKRLIMTSVLLALLGLKPLWAQHFQELSPRFKKADPTNYPILTNGQFSMKYKGFTLFNNPLSYKHELPKGAVFCRMEEHLWYKFNVWIKFRAGNDEMYRKLIEAR